MDGIVGLDTAVCVRDMLGGGDDATVDARSSFVVEGDNVREDMFGITVLIAHQLGKHAWTMILPCYFGLF